MLQLTHPANPLLMLVIPLVLGTLLARRYKVRWGLFGAGALTFVASQVIHIPLNYGVAVAFDNGTLPLPPESWRIWLLAIGLGLSAGICEEVARWVGLRFFVDDVRDVRKGVMYGAGHGGVESMILGALVGWSYLQMVMLQDADMVALGIPPEQVPLLTAQVENYWSMAWWTPLMAVAERIVAMTCHIAMTLMVLRCFTRDRIFWLGLAILFHAMLDAPAVFIADAGPAEIAGYYVLFFLAGLGIILSLWERPEKEPAAQAEPLKPVEVRRLSIEESAQSLED